MRYRHLTALAVLVTLFAAGPAASEIKESAPDALLLEYVYHVHAPPERVYAAITEIGHWWNGEHTYSGDAANLSLKAEAGACFCETWKDGSVRHGQVVMAMHDKVLRIETALGPLQARAVNGILTFALKPNGELTDLAISYRINGSASSHLEKTATGVNSNLDDQFQRLVRYIETGHPTPS